MGPSWIDGLAWQRRGDDSDMVAGGRGASDNGARVQNGQLG